MLTSRVLRLPAYVAASALVVVGFAASPASAAKPAPAPTNVQAQVDGHQDGSYDVTTTWNAVPNATSYRVSLTKGNTTLASGTVTATSWSPHFTTLPGSATLQVRGVVGKKPGRIAKVTVPLPDKVAPRGSYTSAWDNNTGEATITQQSLTDNLPTTAVTRKVDWNDPLDPATVSWTTGATLTHTYAKTEARYVPTVTLEDAAGNKTVVDVDAIVINDDEAPTGTFANQTTTAWAAFTKVTVSQSAIDDNWTPNDLITRSVAWGDGTTSAWTGTGAATHTYAAAGEYTPVVTLTDEAGNSAAFPTSKVVVSADKVGPTVKVAVSKPKHSVKAWKTVHGRAVDAETGVKSVWMKAVEKRGSAWYGYNATTHVWVKAATKAKAYKSAKAFHRPTDAQHRWTAKLAKLKKGTLVLKVRATDRVGNHSAMKVRTATLTKG